MVVVPANFTRELVRGEHPAVLVAVQATGPSASNNALAALNALTVQALRHPCVRLMDAGAGGLYRPT